MHTHPHKHMHLETCSNQEKLPTEPIDVLSWFNPSQQLSTTQPLPPPRSQWGEEEERKTKK